MRRTPPVDVQVIPPFKPSLALLKKRLIDFDTGSPVLEEQHKTWLSGAITQARKNSAFHVRIYGYASKLGAEASNKTLSRDRMNSVFVFMKGFDGRVLNSIEMWEPYGSTAYNAAGNDDAPEYRAVEVHIFIGEPPPLEPPEYKKVPPPPPPPLPGGTRYGKWAVAAPGGSVFTVGPSIGGVVTVGVSIGFNVFFVRNEQTQEVRRYVSPTGGLGASAGLPAKTISWKNAIQTFITGPNYSGVSFEPVYAKHPTTWEEIESCLVTVQGVNAGVGVLSGSMAVITFNCPGVQQYGQSGLPLKLAEDLWSFNSSGRNFQLGVGGGATTGPLIAV